MEKNCLRVTETHPELDSVSAAFGITDERAKELMGLMETAHASQHVDGGRCAITTTLSLVSEYCKHANELCYISFMVGTLAAKASNPIGDLGGFLRFLAKRHGNPDGDHSGL